ncbi:MAG: glycine cleavage system protein GcvH [Ignavibacteria bacterium]|nr:glycine cleavage system protein GcvH [Ignavibacteria bacterium]
MNVPEDLKYTKDHEWVRVEGNIGTVGLTEHAVGELGDVVYVDIPDATASLAQGDTFGTVEAVKTVADLYAPVGGTLTEVNPINGAPDIVNRDPYGDGWLVKIEMTDAGELDGLMSAAEYKAHTGQ